MKNCLAAAAFVLVALTAIGWGYGWLGASASAGCDAAVARPEPHFSAAAHRHFSGQTDGWGSMVLIPD